MAGEPRRCIDPHEVPRTERRESVLVSLGMKERRWKLTSR